MSTGCALCALDADPSHPDVIRQGRWWSVTSAPLLSRPGGVIIQARRHVERIWDLQADEAASLGVVLAAAAGAVREACGAFQVYTFAFGEVQPHYHVAMLPRPADLAPGERGVALVAASLGRPPEDPEAAAARAAARAAIDAALPEAGGGW